MVLALLALLYTPAQRNINALPRFAVVSWRLRGANVRVIAEQLKKASDGGPQCNEPSNSAVETLEGTVCKGLCLDLWERFKDEAMTSSSPYESFMALQANWLTQNSSTLSASFKAFVANCAFGRNPSFLV